MDNQKKDLLFSVSLVYSNYKESALRVLITQAENENEALGYVINYFSEEMEDFCLKMKVVINIDLKAFNYVE